VREESAEPIALRESQEHLLIVTTDGSFRISPEDLERIGGKPFAAQWPPEAGGGYIGFLEVLHQVHCVVRTSLCLHDYTF